MAVAHAPTSLPAAGPAARAVAADESRDPRYRLKNRLLGPPLVTEQLASERLGKPIALGVLAPDCISSSAYGTEEMLTQLVPYVGLAAFTLVVPITFAILGVLFFVTLSYLEVIKLYTKAGGSYVVARDNFGPKIAQIAAVALLIDYTVTVAVQTSAGTAAPHQRGSQPGQHRRHRGHHRRRRPGPALRQPARHPRGRAALRPPDLLLHLLAGLGHHRRLRQGGAGHTSTTSRCRRRPGLRRARRDARARAGSWAWPSSRCCAPSPTAARR